MNFFKIAGVASLLLAMISCGLTAKFRGITTQKGLLRMLQTDIVHPKELSALFPQTVDQITHNAQWITQQTTQELEDIFKIPDNERTFANTVQAFDTTAAQFSVIADVLSILEMVSPDQAIRDACREQVLKLREFAVDTFASKKVYSVFKSYVEQKSSQETLSAEAQYFLDESMHSFARQGFNLPDDEYLQVQNLKKELSKLAVQFDTNIASDHSFIMASKEELEGVDENLFASLEKDEHDNYKLGCDYPTFFEVMDNCHNSETRKKFSRKFNQRAYPQNYSLLQSIMKLRHQLASKLGFESYAALDVDSEMVKTPARAYDFLYNLIKKCEPKVDQEMQDLLNELPEGVQLNDEGKFNPWDFSYIKESYKKKHFDVDERKIAEYFTVEKTIDGIFEIYQNFLGLTFTMVKPEWVWSPDVQLIQVNERDGGRLRGFIFLDLFPRAHKYSHACHAGIISTIKRTDPTTGQAYIKPSVAVVIANFPKPVNGRPALLKFSDVETFFHEFGHGMHALLGSTELTGNSGTAVKTDFVEMPSQMFENWLYEKEILQPLTSHYQTGEQLPDALIEKMIALKKFDSGNFVTRQCLLSLISLTLFDKNPEQDIDQTVRGINKRFVKHVSIDPESHFCASFGHLTGYGAKYYSYMWSKVFAIDVFYYIKKLGGLNNPEVGQRFVKLVLGRGGSIDPDVMLKEYLEREPSQEAFVHDLGIHGL